MAKLTKFMIALAVFSATGGFSYGFGFGVFVSSIGQPGFYKYFNLGRTDPYTQSIIGAVNGLFALGAAIGAITQGFTSDWLGRRMATFAATMCCIVGAGLTAGSVAIPMIVTVRILHGIGVGQLVTLAPLYIAEVAPPQNRGALVGIFAGAIGVGYTTVAWISFGTYYAKSETVQWRVPLALATVGPLIQAIGIWFIPESPRWLIWKDRKEEALAIIKRLHAQPGAGDDHDFAESEYLQICEQVAHDRQFQVSYWQMFRRPEWRRRSLLAMFLLFASQSTGVLGIANYKAIIFSDLGFPGGLPLMMTAVYTMVGSSMVFIGSWIADRTGRRILLLIGFPATSLLLLAQALLQRQYVGTDNKAGLAACVLFLFLYISTYDLTVDPVTFIYVAEIWPTTIRSKGIALAWTAYFIGAITYTAPGALAFRQIGWAYYMVFFACNIVSTVVCYFYVPETKNKSLEEMGELFGDTVVMHMTQDGRIEEKQSHVTEHSEMPATEARPPRTQEV